MGIGEEFIKQTSLKNNGKTLRDLCFAKPALVIEPKEDSLITLKKGKEIEIQTFDLKEAIESRESVREYENTHLTLDELSYLLWCSQGIKHVIPNIVTLRNVPSAGGRHAFETYILVNRVEGIQNGLYHYYPTTHQLALIDDNQNITDALVDAFESQPHIKDSAVTFMWAAVEERMRWSYGERGYRYLLLDAGHICQNVYLAGQSIDCGVCAVAHFDDDKVNELLKLKEQYVLYAATVGKI